VNGGGTTASALLLILVGLAVVFRTVKGTLVDRVVGLL
jgi:hypothetical protein